MVFADYFWLQQAYHRLVVPARNRLLPTLLLLFAVCTNAGANDPVFKRLNTSNGLSQNAVFAILKDHNGFMWFGTDEGLNKYDGYTFTVYKHHPYNRQSISNNSIYDIKEDAAHQIWIVTAAGVDRFDRFTETFTHFAPAEKSISFRSIFFDSQQQIWLASTAGLCLFTPQTGTFHFYKHNPLDSTSISNNFVYRICEDNAGDLWVGTRFGLNRFNPRTQRFTGYYNQPGNRRSIGAGYIKSVFKDKLGAIWVGTQGSGIARFEPGTNSFTNYKHDPADEHSLSYNDILSFTEDAAGQLWIGTENGGISVFNAQNNRFARYQYNENDPFSLSGNSIYCLYRDDIGNIWVGTWSDGINFYAHFGNKFNHHRKIPNTKNGLSSNLVLSITGDEDDNIWIGTDGGGLNRYNPQTGNYTHYRSKPGVPKTLFSDYVLSVLPYERGKLVAGFHRGGVDLINVEKQQFTHHDAGVINPARLTAPSIGVLYKDHKQQIWLGANDNVGLFSFNPETKQFIKYTPVAGNITTFKGSRVFVMYETMAGQFYVGGDRGLDLLDRATGVFTHYQHQSTNTGSISNDMVYSIQEDKNGNLWVGTAGGLNHFDIHTKKFTAYTENDGLPNNTIWGILQDNHNNLWLSTNNGLTRFNPVTKQFRNYTIKDGLQDNTFKLGAAYQSPRGEMYFGGINGFNTFFPDSIKENDFVPPVYLTALSIFNKPITVGENSYLKQSIHEIKSLTLPYHQSVFTLEFAALNFTESEQNKYAYKLEGFDKEWNYIGDKRSATYTNLNPGTYVFRVKGSNNDGVWNEEGRTLEIIITPPFWLTWWFTALLILFVAGCIVAFIRFRLNIINQQKVLLQRTVQQQTIWLQQSANEERDARLEAEVARAESDMARQQLNTINEQLKAKNRELEQFAFVASHDLQEPLRTTTGFVQLLQRNYKGKLDTKADQYLEFISSASGRMRVLITDLLDFSKIGQKVVMQRVDCNEIVSDVLADISFAVHESGAEIHCGTLPILIGYPTEIKLLIQNLLLNAIKFRKKEVAPIITIKAGRKNKHWQFAIADNGIGIAEQHQDKIFDIFQRLHHRSEYDGSGIGLSHCKKIVGLHQGEISVTSFPGKGSTFYFTLFIYPTDSSLPVGIKQDAL